VVADQHGGSEYNLLTDRKPTQITHAGVMSSKRYFNTSSCWRSQSDKSAEFKEQFLAFVYCR